MTIVVNTRGDKNTIGESFLREIFLQLIQSQSNHSFVFITDPGTYSWIPDANNVVKQAAGDSASKNFIQHLWHNYRLPRLLSGLKADVLVNLNGKCNLSTTVPQLLFLPDQAFLPFNKRKHSKLNASLEMAAGAWLVSAFAKKQLRQHFAVPDQKILVTGLPVEKDFQPLDWEAKELVKQQYTGGKEYFFYHGPVHPDKNIMNLLKAFSLFKKRQLSNMQLVLAGPINWLGKGFEEKLSSYKFRSAVILHSQLSQEAELNLTGAAYAIIAPATEQGFKSFYLKAMCCGVPVITCSAEAEPGENIVLHAKASSPEDIANQMKLLYKDEHLRSELIEKGTAESKKYKAELIAEKLWNFIAQTVIIH